MPPDGNADTRVGYKAHSGSTKEGYSKRDGDVECSESGEERHNIIGCDLVELVQLDRGIIMAVDEEGKLKEIKGGFTFLGWGTVIAGTGIVLGGNSSKLKALQENLASFEMMTEWVDAADVPPPGAFITSF